jgi:type I restriction enzyme, R subunit
MPVQSEAALENQLIAQLQKLGYALVVIKDETALIANLKMQLEKHNNCTFSEKEFGQILNELQKGSVFEKAKTLRGKLLLRLDNGDSKHIELLNTEHWCQNQYQVTNQITMQGKYENRYDITLLINGLPLVQIELKRRGIELREAFNQINRYQKHSFGAGKGLFHFIQLFVISNGVNTKYFSNFGNHKQEYTQTFHWTNEDNRPLNNILNGFTDTFLEPCHLSKMICKYIVLNETDKRLMVLRPYQYFAVENIIKKVETLHVEALHATPLPLPLQRNGYIWHTTGSGKTLTSFKASQILSKMPNVKKVVFVVDRKDLDYQTSQEFEKFSKGSVDSTSSTDDLIKKFNDPSVRIIITTIQKLNNAITARNTLKMKPLEKERMVFIFDECHRSQFGDTHTNIVKFFKNVQMFGFTGTPILAENANKEKTTSSLFGKCLHKYIITDAIRDENVLRFSVEYINTFKQKGEIVDLKVQDINAQEVYESPVRKNAIVDYILQYHGQKTHNRTFTGMMCVQNIDELIKYYELFKAKERAGEHNLNVATIFSFAQNEDEMTFDINEELSVVEEPKALYGLVPHRREKLEEYIGHFNEMFQSAHSIKDGQSFYNYYNDIAKKTKDKQIDILLVANMFLTGFDSKHLNTLYVDKNLQYHGLIQAFSRTNRTNGAVKTQGNIVCFRNLKDKTDEAITLFSNKEAIDEIIMQPYEKYAESFNKEVKTFFEIVPTVESVDDLYSEEDQMKFILAFRGLMRLKTKMAHYTEFTWDDLDMTEQTFLDYSSKYQDLKDSILHKEDKQKVSILDDIDFELELIRRDNINVTYIVQLLFKLKSKKNTKEKEAIEKEILNLLNTEASLRSKRELIEQFMKQNLIAINDIEDIAAEFEKFWQAERQKAFDILIKEENLSIEKTQSLIENYLFAEREPLRDEILGLINGEKPSILQRKTLGDRILSKIIDFVTTFIDGMI